MRSLLLQKKEKGTKRSLGEVTTMDAVATGLLCSQDPPPRHKSSGPAPRRPRSTSTLLAEPPLPLPVSIRRAAEAAMVFWERDWWQKREWGCCGCECTWTKAALWLAFLLLTGFLIVAFAVVKPPTATADYGFLTRFELAPSPNSTARPPLQLLSYNATVQITLRNPNYRGISYLAVAAFSFNGTSFDESIAAPDLYLDAQEEKPVRLEVGGVDRALPKLPAAGAAEFARQKEAGVFEVEVRLDVVTQYFGSKTWCPLGIICPLRLQLVDPDFAAIAFKKTKCTILRANISGC